MNKNYIHIENNECLFRNGVYAMCYHLELPEKYSLGKEDYISLKDRWRKALKDLPESIFYKQDAIINKKYDTSNFPESNFLQKSTKKHFNGVDFKDHACFLFFLLPSQSLINENLQNPFKKLKKADFYGFDQRILNYKTAVEEAVNFLSNIKLSGGAKFYIEPFKNWEVKSYYDTYYTLFESDFISDKFFNHSSIKIGEKYAAVVCSLDEEKFPNKFHPFKKDEHLSNDKTTFYRNYGDYLSFDLPFSHLYNQICFLDPKDKHLNDLRDRNNKLHKSISFDKQNKTLAEATDEIITDLVDVNNDVRLIRGHNNVVVFADSEEQLQKNINKTVDAFKSLEIKPYIPKDNYLNAIFNYSFPFHSQYFTDNQLYISSLEVFSTFLNNTGTYKSDKEGILYNSRIDSSPVVVDTWDKKKKYIKARNFWILAPTGEGKSFNANHIIAANISLGVKVVIIDLGGSYRKLATLFPEQTAYVSYQEGVSLGVNPFELSDGDYTNRLSNDKLEVLVEFVGVHCKRDTILKEVEKSSLRKLIEQYYKKTEGDYSLPNFIEFVKKSKDLLEVLNIKEEFFNRDEFLHLMSEFVDGGTYDYLYKEKKENISDGLIGKNIVVFELDAVRENNLLLSIMLQLVSTTIDKVIWSDKSNRGIVLFDEIAEQLKWKGVLGRVNYFFQTIRKQEGAIGIILQSESQMPKNEISEAIIENTQILYVLGAKNYRNIQKRFNLSEHAYYQMASIKPDFDCKRPYSQVFILRGNNHQVYNFESSKEVWWAYQTEGKENDKLLNIYKEKGDMEKAIEIIMQK